MQEYQKKNKKLYTYFVDLVKTFHRVPRKVKWAIKKGSSEVMIRAVLSACVMVKRQRVGSGSAYSEKFEVIGGVHQGSVLWPLLFAIVANVITENARMGVVYQLQYADDLAFMSETMEGLKERFWNWKDALESKGLRSTSEKQVMASELKELFKSKIDLVEFERE